MAFSVPLIDNSILFLGKDNQAIQMALHDKTIKLSSLEFQEGEYPDFDELQQRLQDIIKKLN